MKTAIIGFILIAISLAIAMLYVIRINKDKGTNKAVDAAWPYRKKTPFMGAAELDLYERLLAALPEMNVFAQVEMNRVVTWPKPDKNGWSGRVNGKSIDFLICTKASEIVLAIELDDKTHNRPDRQKADETKDRALKAAGIPIKRWNVRSMPQVPEIRQAVAEAINGSKPQPEPNKAPSSS